MRGSSVHFKRIANAMHAVSHASRQAPPAYLLPPEHSQGTHVVIDDHGQVQKLLDEKMALASRQAKATKDYSPLWEGVINLPAPSPDMTPARQIEIVKQWCVEYEAMTGHKVIRADVHLDEGFIDEAGQPNFNSHAHVMCDRTDDKGKVKKLTSTVLREVQNMTANVTTLQRGLDARQTGRKHINHHNFKFDAEKNRLGLDKANEARSALESDLLKLIKTSSTALSGHQLEISRLETELELASESAANKVAALEAKLADSEERYRLARQELKDSKTAKQSDYSDLKKSHDLEVAELRKELAATKAELTSEREAHEVTRTKGNKARMQAIRVPFLVGELGDRGRRITNLETKVETMEKDLAGQHEKWTQKDYELTDALNKAALANVENRRLAEANAKLEAQLEADRVRYAAMANDYQAWKAQGQNPALFVPAPPKMLIYGSADGEELQDPPAQWITGFAPSPQANGWCEYKTVRGKVGFVDTTSEVAFAMTDPATLAGGLKLAAQKWPDGYTLTGSDAFKQEALALSVAMGHKVANPELQDSYNLLKQAVEAAKPQTLPEPLPSMDEYRLGQLEAAMGGYFADGSDQSLSKFMRQYQRVASEQDHEGRIAKVVGLMEKQTEANPVHHAKFVDLVEKLKVKTSTSDNDDSGPSGP